MVDIIGLPAGKNKTIAIDLTDKFLSSDHQVKIATDMQIYWDAAFFSIGDDNDLPIQVTELSPERADLHHRGFSKMYRPTPHAPHLFDYDEVTTTGQWRDLRGHYTRFGDVTPLLQSVDDMYVIMNAGDEMTVEFDAGKLPPLQDGWVRGFYPLQRRLGQGRGYQHAPLPIGRTVAFPRDVRLSVSRRRELSE